LITNDGKNILAKYLINQAPTYASHIAVGCGAEPLLFSNDLDDYSNKKTLDFEMFRVPIVSRGYVEEEGVSKIVFTGELPSEERYEITEIGIFSAGSNVNAGASDSKILFSFSSAENWEFHDTLNDTAEQLDNVLVPLNSTDSNFIDSEYDSTAFFANSTNGVFDTEVRLSIQERPRLLDSSIFISGSTCQIEESGDNDLQLLAGSLSKHVHYTNINVDELAQNSSSDIIKTAFSIIGKEASIDDDGPDEIKVIVEFLSSEEAGATLARIPIVYEKIDFFSNRYLVNETTLGQMKGKQNGFTWQGVNVARIYASAEKEYEIESDGVARTDSNQKLEFTTTVNHGFAVGSKVVLFGVEGITDLRTITDVTDNKFKIEAEGSNLPTLENPAAKAPTSNYLIAMDGVRLENISTPNSLYALTAYSPIVNSGYPIVKVANSSNVVEFRFAMSVGGESVGPES
jgi:hypothetical protein